MQDSQTLINVSVVFYIPSWGRFSHHRLAALLEEFENGGPAASGIEVILAAAIDPESLDNKTAEALAAMLERHPRLKLGRMDAASSGGALLNSAMQQARGSRIACVDSRAYLKAEAILLMRHSMDKAGAAAAFVPQPEARALLSRGFAADSGLNLLVALLRTPTPPAIAMWDKDLFKSIGPLDKTLDFTMLNDLLLRAAEQSRILAVNPDLANMPPSRLFADKKTRPQLEQRAMDEEYRMLDAALSRFVDGELPAFSNVVLAKEMNRHARATMAQLRALQGDGKCSVQDICHSAFAFALLSLRFNEYESARQTLDTVISIISEQRDIMRLYRWLVMRKPLNHPLPSTGAERIEGAPSGPQVVVATPLFNQGRYLRETVDSVRAQTWPNWRMVIVDDSSTDDSYEQARSILADLEDPRITLLQHENSGLGATRNRAIREVPGAHVVCLDADDTLAPDHFAICLDMLNQNPRAGWISPKTLVFGQDNHIAFHEDFDFVRSLLISVSPCSSMIRREALDNIDLFREDLTAREDWERWLEMAEHGWIAVTTTQPLFFYRHAVRRPGLKTLSNIPSKEEIISLHPWWYRVDLSQEVRLKAYSEFGTVRFSPWFLNMRNVERISPVLHDREAFLTVMAEVKAEYPPITKPKRWNDMPDDCCHVIRRKKYGIPFSSQVNWREYGIIAQEGSGL